MLFKGHKFVKLVNDNWVLDLTDFMGYKVETDNNNGSVVGYTQAFKIMEHNGAIEIDKYIRIPIKILKEASNQVSAYLKDFED